MEKSKKDSVSKFSSAMGSLKGILDKEGLVNTKNRRDFIPAHSFNESVTPDATTQYMIQTEDDVPVNSNNIGNPPILDGTISIIDEADAASIALDAYISDLDDDEFDIIDFNKTPSELEKKLKKITHRSQIEVMELSPAISLDTISESPVISSDTIAESDYAESGENLDPNYVAAPPSKKQIQQHLTAYIETSIDELKSRLISSLNAELENLFNKNRK